MQNHSYNWNFKFKIVAKAESVKNNRELHASTKYQSQWFANIPAAVSIEWFFSEPPSRVKSIINIPSLLSISLVLYQVKITK